MRIVLIRHGKPDLPKPKPIMTSEFPKWISLYNSTELCESSVPSIETIELSKTCNYVVCSNLHRSIASAERLGITRIDLVSSELREMEMPWWPVKYGWFKPIYWSILFRLAWFLGFSNNCESFKSAKNRAAKAGKLLTSKAMKNQTVLFIGHGLLNKYIAKYLISKGWSSKKNLGNDYWQYSIYEKNP